jgi:phage tail protein X
MILDEPDSYELITVSREYTTVDFIVWQRYTVIALGVYERTLDDNPHLAKIHRYTPFLPIGTQLRIPIFPRVLANAPSAQQSIKWWEPFRDRMRTVLTTVTAEAKGESIPGST